MKFTSIAALALLAVNYVGAADVPAATPSASQAQQDEAPLGTPVQTSGKVTSMHNVTMVNVADQHTVVKIETEEGNTDIVDLGSTADLKANGIEPKEGQKFWVEGRVGKINDKFLIVAEQLSESKLVSIARTSALNEESVRHADARKAGTTVPTSATEANGTNTTSEVASKDPQSPKTETIDAGHSMRTIEGTVIHSRHVRIDGEADEHVFAKIKTENGVAVIDLGTCPNMPSNVSLAEGQSIIATGFVGQMNGKPIILADSVGNVSPIQRAQASETLPTSTAPAAPIK